MNKDGLEESNFMELTANKTIHEIKLGMAFYNNQGLEYSLFKSFNDAINYIETCNEKLIIKTFDSEEAMDKYILKHYIK